MDWTNLGGLAWLVARYIASPRTVALVIGGILVLLLIMGATWTLSSADSALYLAREMVWSAATVWDYQKYPQRAINNAPPVFHFTQNPSPELGSPAHLAESRAVFEALVPFAPDRIL